MSAGRSSRPFDHSQSGTVARAADTLLIERARDYLAAGPADAAALVERVCQMPGVPPAIAERLAAELLGERAVFARLADGRWALTDVAPAPREAGAPVAAPRIPTFAEWQAARAAAAHAVTPAISPHAPRNPSPHVMPADGDDRDGHAAAPPPARAARRAHPPAPRALPGDDDLLRDLSYVVVDVETTGGSPEHGHRVTEIAAVAVDRGEVREVYETLVNPGRPIPPEIVRLTGITWEMVRDQRPFHAVSDAVLAALGGRVFVAHNVTFDWRFVSHEVARASGRVLDGRRLCTVRLARKLLPHLRSRSLGYVAEWYGATRFAETYFAGRRGTTGEAGRPWRHSAAGDAVATAHCLLRLLDDAAAHGVYTWGEMDRWLAGGTHGGTTRRRKTAMPTGVRRDPLG